MLYFSRALTVISASFLAVLTVSASEPIPIEDFARLPVVSMPRLSPDGQRVALTIVSKGTPIVVVQPLTPELKKQGIGKIGTGKYHIHQYIWANNERLILSVRDSQKFRGNLFNYTKLLLADWNGKNITPVKTDSLLGIITPNPYILTTLPDENDFVLGEFEYNKYFRDPNAHKINVYTGETELYERNARGLDYWISDEKGNILVGGEFGFRSSGSKTYFRSNNNSEWKLLEKTDYFNNDRLVPFKFDDDRPNILLMTTRSSLNDDDWRWLEEIEGSVFEYDLIQEKIIGEYLNKRLLEARTLLEKKFPDKKVVFRSRDLKKEKYIVQVSSDINPAIYYLYDSKKKSLQRIGREYPQLEGKVFSPMQEIKYPARDGYDIPAFLTIPNKDEKTNLPLIVYPHGGPISKDDWGFDPRVQYFASRGYVVLQPQFRGSTGYGMEHEEAGYGEWGDLIQDDISDGVHHLINTGLVDPEKVCIVGASFGGYAAAFGLAKTPELYRCGISINGVMSLTKRAGEGVLRSAYGKQYQNDASELTMFSPSTRANKIQAPLLLIASKKDTVVPYSHSRDMYKKMNKLGKEVEYLELEDGEHWRTNEAVEIEILEAIDAFLQTHLPTGV